MTNSSLIFIGRSALLMGHLLLPGTALAQKARDFRTLTIEQRADGKLGVVLNPPNLEAKGAMHVGAVKMCFCPPGQVLLVDRDDFSKVHTADINTGFWICQTELSQSVYFALLRSNPKFWAIHGNRTIPDAYINSFKEVHGVSANDKIGPDFPIFGLSGREAAAFCLTLNEMLDSQSGFLQFRVRLPTYKEWQYACRARQEADAVAHQILHFPCPSPWKTPDLLPKPELDTAVWKKTLDDLKIPRSEFGTQDSIVRLMDGLAKMGDRALVVRNDLREHYFPNFWERLTGEKRVFNVSRKTLDEVTKQHVQNDWLIQDMLGNVAEWTLREETDWQELRVNKLPASYFLAGGGVQRILDAEDEWKRFTIWGGEEIAQGIADSEPGSMGFGKYTAGFRFIIVAEVDGQFVRRLRNAALDGNTKEIFSGLSAMKGMPLDSAALKLRNYYEAIATYQHNMADKDKRTPFLFSQQKDLGAASDEELLLSNLDYLSQRDKIK